MTEVVVKIRCECGAIAMMRLTLEQARRHASDVLAAADGLEPVEVQVRGEG